MKRRGIETRLVLASGRISKMPNLPLLKSVAKARAWFEEIVSGKVGSLVEIASREGVTDTYVANLLSLALLAPAVVEAIAAGRQPVTPKTKALISRARSLPLDWATQARQLGPHSGNQ